MNRLRYSVSSIGILTALAFTSAPNVAAQDADTEESFSLEEIIITARRRNESLQDVPLAITAFDAAALQKKNIQDLDDVARFTAGFSFEDFDGGNASPVIRGAATLRTNAREQTVATFIDGVYMPRSWLVDLGTTNLQRIEIVKGPQSARFGRNAFAGAINFIPNKARINEQSVFAQATYGNHNRFDIGGAVSIPLVEDRISVGVSYDHSEFGGTWENDHPNANAGLSPGTDGNVGGWNNETYSASIALAPVDNLQIDAAIYKFERSEEARAAVWQNTRNGGNCGALQRIDGGGQGGSLFCGEFDFTGDSVTVDPRGFGRQSDSEVIRASISYDISEAWNATYTFGHVTGDTITANTAESDTINCGTILGPPNFPALCNFQAAPLGNVDYEQHELRIAFEDEGPLRFAFGGFIMDGFDDRFSVSANVAPGGTTPLAISDQTSAGVLPFPLSFSNFVFGAEETETVAKSLFGEFTYAFNEGKTRVSAEGRYTSEEITTVGGGNTFNETFNFFTPRFTIEHDLENDSLIYATVARGVKAGGFNSAAVSPEFVVFDPESNWTYELGSKNTLLDGSFVLNGAIFLTKWADQQINSLDPLGTPFTATLTRNLGNATIWGIELEGTYRATENVTFDFAFSHTEGTYDDGTIDELFTRGFPIAGFPPPCDDVVCSTAGDIGGNDLERAPDTQFSVGGQWEDTFGDDYRYFLRADVGYQSSFFSDSLNIASSPSRTVFNARAGFDFNQFEIAVWARNLFDEKYVSNSLQIVQSFSNNILGQYLGERRTFGVTISTRF